MHIKFTFSIIKSFADVRHYFVLSKSFDVVKPIKLGAADDDDCHHCVLKTKWENLHDIVMASRRQKTCLVVSKIQHLTSDARRTTNDSFNNVRIKFTRNCDEAQLMFSLRFDKHRQHQKIKERVRKRKCQVKRRHHRSTKRDDGNHLISFVMLTEKSFCCLYNKIILNFSLFIRRQCFRFWWHFSLVFAFVRLHFRTLFLFAAQGKVNDIISTFASLSWQRQSKRNNRNQILMMEFAHSPYDAMETNFHFVFSTWLKLQWHFSHFQHLKSASLPCFVSFSWYFSSVFIVNGWNVVKHHKCKEFTNH